MTTVENNDSANDLDVMNSGQITGKREATPRYWFSRPKRQVEAQDPTTFADALETLSEDILKKCGTPREVRRFLNYLRLVAAPNDEPSREGIQELRKRIGDFDARLVELATLGTETKPGPDEVEGFYLKQCQIFGIDPETFLPQE
jgi:hypothetical protein